jgi:hypothetical protein
LHIFNVLSTVDHQLNRQRTQTTNRFSNSIFLAGCGRAKLGGESQAKAAIIKSIINDPNKTIKCKKFTLKI